MVEIPITPTYLVAHEFVFSVSRNAVQGAVIFHVTVTNSVVGNPFRGPRSTGTWLRQGLSLPKGKNPVVLT